MKKQKVFFNLPVLGMVLCLLFPLYASSTASETNIHGSDLEAQIETLLDRMTLEEKIGQMHQVSGISDEYRIAVREGKIGSFLNVRGAKVTNEIQKIAVEESRLGIPLIFGNDVIHGYRTIFPIPLAEAATWDPELVERAASVAAREASAAGTHWTFAPMVDIARDPRWGRIAEGAGEDPYLGSIMAAARVRGFQGDDLTGPGTIVACPKHYVAYGAAEGGRDYNIADMSLQMLRNVYLPPFQEAIESGAGTVMSAFNEISGVPASANRLTITRILKEEWGFEGFVVSDWNSIGELMNHGIAGTETEAGRRALLAGVDMDMQGFIYSNTLAGLVERGEISEESIDEAVRRILRIKFRLGLFEHPYVDPEPEEKILLSEENRNVALEVARKSIVLLKNNDDLLPLSKEIGSLALIGPLADNQKELLGCWDCEGRTDEAVTIRKGLQNKIPSKRIHYEKGCDIDGSDIKGIVRAVKQAKESDVAILVVGESADMSGEAACRSSLDLPGVQSELVQAVHETGTPVVVVLMNGRPLAVPWLAEHVPAIIEAWQLGTQCGHAIADVIFGDVNPGGKLPVTFPRNVGQVPIYYNFKNTGRPPGAAKYTSKYLDVPMTPLYPFGYGLSYTEFKYDDLQIESAGKGTAFTVSVRASVKNTGDIYGEEVVQLYLRDVQASVTRPVKELKGFRRIRIDSGKKEYVEFVLTHQDLGLYDESLNYVVESGFFKVWIGPNSVDGLQAEFKLDGE